MSCDYFFIASVADFFFFFIVAHYFQGEKSNYSVTTYRANYRGPITFPRSKRWFMSPPVTNGYGIYKSSRCLSFGRIPVVGDFGFVNHFSRAGVAQRVLFRLEFVSRVFTRRRGFTWKELRTQSVKPISDEINIKLNVFRFYVVKRNRCK